MNENLSVDVVAALNSDRAVIGIYAVDLNNFELGNVQYSYIVNYPDDPVENGKTFLVPEDPENPESEMIEIPQKKFPEIDWKYVGGVEYTLHGSTWIKEGFWEEQ